MGHEMSLHDLSYYIDDRKNTVQDKFYNLFRRQYPDHVKRTSRCIQELRQQVPKRPKLLVKKYRLTTDHVKRVGGFEKLSQESIIKKLKR